LPPRRFLADNQFDSMDNLVFWRSFSNAIILSSFSDYLLGYPNMTIENQKITRAYNEKIYIFNTLYEDCKMKSAVYLPSRNKRLDLVIEQSSFAYCETGGAGGGIYYSNYRNGCCVLNKICAFKCRSHGSMGNFLYVYGTINHNITLSMISAYMCAPSITDYSSQSCIKTYYSNIDLKDSNITRVSANSNSAIDLLYPSVLGITFFSVSDSFSSVTGCIYIYSSTSFTSNINISHVNIVRNTQPDINTGIFYTFYSTINISNSIFIDNIGTLFQNYKSSTGFMYLNDCYIKHPNSYVIFNYTKYSTSNIIESSSYTQTIPIAHYQTYYCLPHNLPLAMEQSFCQTLPPPPTICSNSSPHLSIGYQITTLFSLNLALFLLDK